MAVAVGEARKGELKEKKIELVFDPTAFNSEYMCFSFAKAEELPENYDSVLADITGGVTTNYLIYKSLRDLHPLNMN